MNEENTLHNSLTRFHIGECVCFCAERFGIYCLLHSVSKTCSNLLEVHALLPLSDFNSLELPGKGQNLFFLGILINCRDNTLQLASRPSREMIKFLISDVHNRPSRDECNLSHCIACSLSCVAHLTPFSELCTSGKL